MLHNTGRPVDANAPAEQRLMSNVTDLFTTGAAPGARVQDLLNDIAGCNVEGFQKKDVDQNTARYLKRRLTRYSSWPSLFEQQITVANPDAEEDGDDAEAIACNFPPISL